MSPGARALLALACVAALASSACTFGSRRVEEDTAPVPTAAAQRGAFRVVVEEVGVLRARKGERLRPQTWGTIETLVPDGTEVKPGDVVVQLDTSELVSRLTDVEADLRESRSEASKQLERLSFQEKSQALDLAVSRATLEFARRKLASARTALEDAERQLGLGLISVGARDQKAEALTSAEYEAERAEVAHERKVEEIASQRRGIDLQRQQAERTFAQLDQRRDQVQKEIDSAAIVSPGAGRVFYVKRRWRGSSDERKPREGDQIGPWIGAVAEIPDLESIEARSQVDETLLGRIPTGTPVEIAVGAVDGLVIPGQVEVVDVLGVARSRSEGGGFRGEQAQPDEVEQVVFPTTIELERSDDRLQPGMTVSVTYVLETVPDAVSVPEAAVFGAGGSAFLFVETRRGPERRDVTLGASSSGRVVIVSGLDVGEVVYLGDPRGAGGGAA